MSVGNTGYIVNMKNLNSIYLLLDNSQQFLVSPETYNRHQKV